MQTFANQYFFSIGSILRAENEKAKQKFNLPPPPS
jgi:hypothetical protein